MPVIVFENGPDKGRKVTLQPDKIFTGGRDENCELNIKDELSAPRHFKIREHQGKYYIRDLGTESTVLVNDEPTHQAELKYNDKIQVGDTILTFLEAAKSDPYLGLTVSGYEFIEHLGRGGMGTVYRARQVSLNRDVAIKRLSPRLTKNAEFRERFISEARAAGAFNHPNVLQVFDVIHEEDICFYSMEYIPGGTVGDLLNTGPVPPDRAVRIIKDAAQGLLYAEQKLIMHHDIKPQNLMITELGSVKISDMGLAGSLEDAAKGGGATLLGTPHFMSPERIQRKELDIRSDIYSLGCTLYMILTGRTPFHGETVKQILIKQMKEEPTPVRELRPEVPDSLEDILERMMAKDPSDRYAGAQELLDDLETLQLGKRRGPLVTLLAVAVVVLIAAGAYLFTGKDPQDGGSEQGGTAEQNNGSEEASAYREQVEDLTKERNEKDALIEYLKIREDAAEPDRLAQLQAIASRFPNTPTGEKASREAGALREKMEKAREAEQAKLAAIQALKEKGKTDLDDYLSRDRFGEAAAYVFRLGTREGLAEEKEITAYKAKAMTRIKTACTERCDTLLKDGAALVAKQDFQAARKLLEEGRGLFNPPRDDPGPEGKAHLEETAVRITSELAETARKEREYFLGLYRSDLDAFTKALDPVATRSQVMNYGFETAAKPFENLVPSLKTGAYINHARKLHTGIEGAARLMNKLIEAVSKGEMPGGDLQVPGGGSRDVGPIAGLTDEGDGIKILVTQAGRSRLSNVPFHRFSSAEGFVRLLDGRFTMSGEEKLQLAEAALHFAAARCAAQLQPLVKAIKAYDPESGWTADLLQAVKIEPLLVAIGPEVTRLVQEAGALDPDLAERSSALLDRLAEEEAAVETFYASAAPFLDEQPEIGFERAETMLRDFARNYSNTIFFWYILDLMGGSSRPDSHLVEFSR